VKTRIILGVVIISNAVGDVSLSYGMKQVGDISALPLPQLAGAAIKALFHPWVALGVVLLTIFIVSFATALSWADLSYVLPATAVGYILVAFLSHWVLHESLNGPRWAGTALIAVGVMLVARTEVRTT
jgi:drug/metabolite transporter (DMT)-like permease